MDVCLYKDHIRGNSCSVHEELGAGHNLQSAAEVPWSSAPSSGGCYIQHGRLINLTALHECMSTYFCVHPLM